jgi:hypothetical protein
MSATAPPLSSAADSWLQTAGHCSSRPREGFDPAVLTTHRGHVEIRIGMVSTRTVARCRSRMLPASSCVTRSIFRFIRRPAWSQQHVNSFSQEITKHCLAVANQKRHQVENRLSRA